MATVLCIIKHDETNQSARQFTAENKLLASLSKAAYAHSMFEMFSGAFAASLCLTNHSQLSKVVDIKSSHILPFFANAQIEFAIASASSVFLDFAASHLACFSTLPSNPGAGIPSFANAQSTVPMPCLLF